MTIRDSVAGIASSIRVDRAKSRWAEAEIAASALSGPEQVANHVGNGDKMLFTNAPIPNKSLGIKYIAMIAIGHSVPAAQT